MCKANIRTDEYVKYTLWTFRKKQKQYLCFFVCFLVSILKYRAWNLYRFKFRQKPQTFFKCVVVGNLFGSKVLLQDLMIECVLEKKQYWVLENIDSSNFLNFTSSIMLLSWKMLWFLACTIYNNFATWRHHLQQFCYLELLILFGFLGFLLNKLNFISLLNQISRGYETVGSVTFLCPHVPLLVGLSVWQCQKVRWSVGLS